MTNKNIICIFIGFLVGIIISSIAIYNSIGVTAEILATENRLLIEWVAKNHGKTTARQLQETVAVGAMEAIRYKR